MRDYGASDVGWTIVRAAGALDPRRYLGEFSDLPLHAAAPGDWCHVVIHDSRGEMRWTFVAVRGASLSVADDRGKRAAAQAAIGRRAPVRPLREWEREDEAAAASSAPTVRRAAARTAANRSGRVFRLAPQVP